MEDVTTHAPPHKNFDRTLIQVSIERRFIGDCGDRQKCQSFHCLGFITDNFTTGTDALQVMQSIMTTFDFF